MPRQLITVVTILAVSLVGCAVTRTPVMHTAPRLVVTPDSTLVDERVHLRATGLPAGIRVVVRSSMSFGGAALRAEATFVAGAEGQVDLVAMAPVAGSY